MNSYPIRLRTGGTYGRDLTDGEAVEVLRGGHRDGAEYHAGDSVHVVRVYPEDVTEVHGFGKNAREVTRKAGDPVFGEEATVYPVGQAYGGPEPAKVSWGSLGAMTTADAAGQLEVFAKAIGLARAANNRPCARCAADYAARYARKDGEQA